MSEEGLAAGIAEVLAERTGEAPSGLELILIAAARPGRPG
jgi:hypothetical protein